MDIDRFWELIEQARAGAGDAADRAARRQTHDKPDLPWTDDLATALASDLSWAPAPPHPNGNAGPDASTDPGIRADGAEDDADDDDPVAAALVRVLARLEPDEIVAFEWIFDHVRATAERAELADAAALIERGPLSDDSLDDFRAGLVALGRTTFEAALADPDSLAAHPAVREIAGAPQRYGLSREQVLYAAGRAYVEATGRDEITFLDAVTALAPVDGLPAEPDPAATGRPLPRLTALFLPGR